MASLYQAFVEIVPEAKNLRKTLAREFDAAGPEAGRNAGKGISSGVLGSVGKLAGPLAAAFAAIGIGGIIKDSIANASDFAESGTAITAVFGDADTTIQKFAANSAAALGQSKNQTLDAARTFGVFGKAAGLSGQDLAGFSTDFITLSADLASFNNTTPEEAIQALGAGLRGESEPLRKYGILLDDATLKARATELGIYSGTGALTAQQKVLASQAEIMAQAGVQQGDFAKTSGGLANQQRILSAGLTNLSTTFGALLLPVMTTVVGFLNTNVVPALTAFATILPNLGSSLAAAFNGEPPTAALGAWTEPITTFGALLRTVFDGLAPVFAALLPQLVELWQAFSPLSLVFAAIGPQLPVLVAAFAELAAALAVGIGAALVDLLPSITALSDSLVVILAGLLTAVLPALTSFASFLADNSDLVLTFAVAIGAAVLAFNIYTGVMAIVRAATVAWGVVQAALNVILSANPIGIVILAIVALVAAIVFVATQTTFFQDAWQVMVKIFQNSIGMFRDFGRNTLGMFRDFFSNTMGMFSDFGSNISGFFSSLPGIALKSGRALIQGFIDGIGSMLGGVGDAVGGVMDFVGGFFPNSPADRGQFAGSGWTKLRASGEAIGDQFGAGLEGATAALSLGSTLKLPSAPRLDASVYGSASYAMAGASGSGASFSQTINAVQGQSAAEIAAIARNDMTSQLRKTI